MSVNLGGVAFSDAGEGVFDALEVEAGVLVAVPSGVGELVLKQEQGWSYIKAGY